MRKLIKKERVGSKIKKQYGEAITPYRRVLASPYISEEIKRQLERPYAILNPAQLKREITRLQNELYRLNVLKQNRAENTIMGKKAQGTFEYIST